MEWWFESMMQSNLNIVAEITEITENSDRCLQFAFAVEDLYPEVARKWTLSILSNLTLILTAAMDVDENYKTFRAKLEKRIESGTIERIGIPKSR